MRSFNNRSKSISHESTIIPFNNRPRNNHNHAFLGKLKSTTMNYFELKCIANYDENEFVELKGTTSLSDEVDIYDEFRPPCWRLIAHEYTINVYNNWTSEDILRHQLKTAL